MTRLANMEKAGYFPLPPLVTHLISTFITAPHGGRIFDPCTGEGTALVSLAETLALSPYGVELHEERARLAREKIQALQARLLVANRSAQLPTQTRLLHDSYQNVQASRDGFNLLYLNPPYDQDE
ncbi:MAG: N-6 DNA methylase [Anaerolineaceae bacterium]|nr:N-6 DNA methylase [Anaerolineaceae bacterium]